MDVFAGHPKPFYTQNSGGMLLTMPSTQLSKIGTKEILVNNNETFTSQQKEILSLLENNSSSTAELKKKLSFDLSERWLRKS